LEEPPAPPSLAATISALDVLRRYLLTRDDKEKELENLQLIEDKLQSERFANLKQTQITRFFKPL
jgi:hypothetical protein